MLGVPARAPRHDVERSADAADAVQHRRRSVQHFDALDRPRIEGPRDVANLRQVADAVVEKRDAGVAEAARGHRRAAGTDRRRRRDADRSRDGGVDVGITAEIDIDARQRGDRRRRFERRQIEPAARLGLGVEAVGQRAVERADHLHRVGEDSDPQREIDRLGIAGQRDRPRLRRVTVARDGDLVSSRRQVVDPVFADAIRHDFHPLASGDDHVRSRHTAGPIVDGADEAEGLLGVRGGGRDQRQDPENEHRSRHSSHQETSSEKVNGWFDQPPKESTNESVARCCTRSASAGSALGVSWTMEMTLRP